MRILFLLFIFPIKLFAMPAYSTDKAEEIPNVCQSCFPKIIKWGGKPHCAPAAVSNSLFWLSKNGFPALQPFHSNDALLDHAKLVDLLGTKMDTTENAGTTPMKVLTGLKKYLDEKKISYKRMAATGWRDIPSFVLRDDPLTKIDWIKQGTLEKNSTWILIGWSKYDSKADHYKIYDGHWMTVVGFGKNRKGDIDPNIIIVHDPAERAERKNYYATVTELKQGTIENGIKAAGVLYLSGDVILKPGADFGLIQGAYRLEL